MRTCTRCGLPLSLCKARIAPCSMNGHANTSAVKWLVHCRPLMMAAQIERSLREQGAEIAPETMESYLAHLDERAKEAAA